MVQTHHRWSRAPLQTPHSTRILIDPTKNASTVPQAFGQVMPTFPKRLKNINPCCTIRKLTGLDLSRVPQNQIEGHRHARPNSHTKRWNDTQTRRSAGILCSNDTHIGGAPDRVFWIVNNMKKDETEAEKKEIRDAKLKAKKAGITLRKVRKKLYIFSAISLVYVVYGLHIRFQLFENGTTGIGFQNGFAIEGLNDLVVETVLLVTMVIILFRFVWYAAEFAYAHFAHYRLNRLFTRKEFERWETYKYYDPNLAKEEEYRNHSSAAVLEDEAQNTSSGIKLSRFRQFTRSVFNTFSNLDTIVFPILFPLIVAILAIYRLYDMSEGYILLLLWKSICG